MKTPGLKIEEVFKATRVSVTQASDGKQTPWDESSLQNDFYFAAGSPAPGPNPNPNPAPKPVNKGSVVKTRAELTVSVKGTGGKILKDAVVTVDDKSAKNGMFSVNMLDEAQKDVSVKVTAPGYDGQLLTVTLTRGNAVMLPVTLEAVAPDPAPVPKKQKLGADAIVLNDIKIAFAPIPGYTPLDKSLFPQEMQVFSLLYFAPPVNGFSTNITVLGTENTSGDKVERSDADELLKLLQSQFPGYKKDAVNVFTVGGETAVSLSGTFSTKEGNLHDKRVLIGHKKTAYIITFTALASEYAKQVGGFDAMMQSIEWR